MKKYHDKIWKLTTKVNRKTIIVTLLTIIVISSICIIPYKKGKCASSKPAFFPYKPTGEIPVNESVIDAVLNELQTQYPNENFSEYFLFFTFEEWFYEPASNSKLTVYIVPIKGNFTGSFSNGLSYQTFYPANDNQVLFNIQASYYSVEMRTGNLLDKSRWIIGGNGNTHNLHIFSNLGQDATAQLYGYDIIPWMPVYSTSDVYINNNDKIIEIQGSEISGHTKGGVLTNYIDSIDLIENDSQLPKVDTTPPTDQTSQPAWYQKILNALGSIGNIIKGGVLTIGDYLGKMWEGLQTTIQNGIDKITDLIEQIIAFWGRAIDKIEDIADDLHTIKEKLTEENTPTEIADAWETGYHSTVFYGMEQNITSARQEFARLKQGGDSSDLNLGRWKITHKQNSISIIGEIDYPAIMGGVTKEHELSFRWYQQIKTWFIPVLNAFIVLGFTLHIIRQFPAFINGQGTDLRSKIEK